MNKRRERKDVSTPRSAPGEIKGATNLRIHGSKTGPFSVESDVSAQLLNGLPPSEIPEIGFSEQQEVQEAFKPRGKPL